MLADQFLPEYDFLTRHSISLRGKDDDAYQKMLKSNADHWLINLLFRLRGIPQSENSPADFKDMGFQLLGEIKGREIAHGIISCSPFFHGCIETFTPDEFVEKYSNGYLRGIIVFGIEGEGMNCKLFTETRVHCGSKRILKRFRIYWFFVKPFSGIIRKVMLKEFKKRIERN